MLPYSTRSYAFAHENTPLAREYVHKQFMLGRKDSSAIVGTSPAIRHLDRKWLMRVKELQQYDGSALAVYLPNMPRSCEHVDQPGLVKYQ